MIITLVDNMIATTKNMQNMIITDIEDIKLAHHEKLLDRNLHKEEMMMELSSKKQELNNLLRDAMENGVDVNQYRDLVNNLENELKELYRLNGKLAAIVLPVKEMYKEIVDELTAANGGKLIEVSA